jgi:uncharacterized membrane protein
VTPYIVDIGTYALSLGLIAGYHVYLKWRVRLEPSYTIQSVNSDARAAWVENIMEEKSNSILAVQTLRNSTMAATFLASTAILLMMGTLNLMQNSHGQNSLLHALQSGIAAGDDLEQIKLLILLATFFWAFFSFSLALQLLQLGYARLLYICTTGICFIQSLLHSYCQCCFGHGAISHRSRSGYSTLHQ